MFVYNDLKYHTFKLDGNNHRTLYPRLLQEEWILTIKNIEGYTIPTNGMVELHCLFKAVERRIIVFYFSFFGEVS